jgi:hypothetical protein
MATTVNNITKLDFDQIKADLKTYMKGQNQFKDYDFEGSNMSMLFDVLSYNTYQNNFYANMAISEMFMDTAQLRDSVVSHAKELNYLPRSYTSASAKIVVKLNVPYPYPSSVVIPAKTRFQAKCGNKTFTFYNPDAVVVNNLNNTFIYNNLEVYEGSYLTEAYNVSGLNTQRFIISNKNVDTSSIRVFVKNAANDVDSVTYMPKTDIFNVAATDKVFYIQPYFNDQYEITFGQNVFGTSPAAGTIVLIEYRMTDGADANGITSVTSAGTISGYTVAVSLNTTSSGGTDLESIESIRYFAPKSIQVQDRAVTKSDYEILLKNKFPEIQAVSAYGGEEEDPPRYGKVIVAVDVNNAFGASENAKNKYYDYLVDRAPLGIKPIVESAKFMYLSVTTDVYFDIRKTSLSPTTIKMMVSNTISTYSTNNLSDFKKTFRYSNFTSAIDNTDSSIVSNDTTVLGMLALNPTLNVDNNYVLFFNNPLITDHPLTTGELISNHKPAIRSSLFTYKGNSTAFLQDDGTGVMNILANKSTGGFVYLNKNAGSVDYYTGKVIIKNLNVSAYSSADVKIYARTLMKDIASPIDRIVTIRPDDVTVNVYGVTE